MAWTTRQCAIDRSGEFAVPTRYWDFEDPRQRVLLEIRGERKRLLAILCGVREDCRANGSRTVAAIRDMQLDLLRLRRAQGALTRDPADPRLVPPLYC